MANQDYKHKQAKKTEKKQSRERQERREQKRNWGNMKPVVHYRKGSNTEISVGYRVTLWPVDHTSPYVSNETYANTSEVVEVFDSGVFETLNTRYVPLEDFSDSSFKLVESSTPVQRTLLGLETELHAIREDIATLSDKL